MSSRQPFMVLILLMSGGIAYLLKKLGKYFGSVCLNTWYIVKVELWKSVALFCQKSLKLMFLVQINATWCDLVVWNTVVMLLTYLMWWCIFCLSDGFSYYWRPGSKWSSNVQVVQGCHTIREWYTCEGILFQSKFILEIYNCYGLQLLC